MAKFSSYTSYGKFSSHVRTSNRHFPDRESKGFLNAIWATSQKRIQRIRTGQKLCRAREGCKYRAYPEGYDVAAPFLEADMLPLPDKAREGRANPKGIPSLYLATHYKTAIAEVRPWLGAMVSVAGFEIIKDLRVIDCSRDKEKMLLFWDEPASQELCERRAWSDVNDAFRRPVTRNDDECSYAPTQIIADFFKSKGLDGIIYGSALGPGKNIALFDLNVVKMIVCKVFEVKKVGVTATLDHSAHTWHAENIAKVSTSTPTHPKE